MGNINAAEIRRRATELRQKGLGPEEITGVIVTDHEREHEEIFVPAVSETVYDMFGWGKAFVLLNPDAVSRDRKFAADLRDRIQNAGMIVDHREITVTRELVQAIFRGCNLESDSDASQRALSIVGKKTIAILLEGANITQIKDWPLDGSLADEEYELGKVWTPRYMTRGASSKAIAVYREIVDSYLDRLVDKEPCKTETKAIQIAKRHHDEGGTKREAVSEILRETDLDKNAAEALVKAVFKGECGNDE